MIKIQVNLIIGIKIEQNFKKKKKLIKYYQIEKKKIINLEKEENK